MNIRIYFLCHFSNNLSPHLAIQSFCLYNNMYFWCTMLGCKNQWSLVPPVPLQKIKGTAIPIVGCTAASGLERVALSPFICIFRVKAKRAFLIMHDEVRCRGRYGLYIFACNFFWLARHVHRHTPPFFIFSMRDPCAAMHSGPFFQHLLLQLGLHAVPPPYLLRPVHRLHRRLHALPVGLGLRRGSLHVPRALVRHVPAGLLLRRRR